jgi:hypothetical protein
MMCTLAVIPAERKREPGPMLSDGIAARLHRAQPAQLCCFARMTVKCVRSGLK